LLERDSFILLTELEILQVYKCGLKTTEFGAFNGLTKLTELSIRGNEISEIIPATFENMNSLGSLHLGSNRIEHLEIDVFRGLVNLKFIYLGENSLQYLHPDTFLGLPNLIHISLRKNPVLQIPTDRHFISSHSLSHIHMSL
jgi:Leucine-rich repeat (LRR) protein